MIDASCGSLKLLEFALPFSLSSINLMPHEISLETLLESKQTPRLSRFLITSIETDQQEVGTNQ
jgi:hypothetical protein